MFEIEIYPMRRGLLRRKQWGWRVRSARNGEIVIPPEGYNNKSDLEDTIADLRVGFPKAKVIEVSS